MNADFTFTEDDLTPEEESLDSESTPIQSHIAEDMEMEGDLNLKYGVEIAGKFQGTMFSNSTIKVLKTGRVEGAIDTHNISIEGITNAQMTAKRRLEVLKGGQFSGTLDTQPEVIVLSEYAAFGKDEETAKQFKEQYSTARSAQAMKEQQSTSEDA